MITGVLWCLVFYVIGCILALILIYSSDIGLFDWCLNPLLDSNDSNYVNSKDKEYDFMTYRELLTESLKSWVNVVYVAVPVVIGIAVFIFKACMKFLIGEGNPSDKKEKKSSWLDKPVYKPTPKEKEKEDKDWHLAKIKKERE